MSGYTKNKIKLKEDNMMIKKIFSRKLAIYLREHGCKIIGVEVNRYKPNFDVYIFEDNEKLQSSLASYMACR